MRNRQFGILLFFILIVAPVPSSGWQGKVVGVIDGDSITVMHDGKPEQIRLYGIDCPEKHQDFGQKSKNFTSEMVFGKTIEVQQLETDRYARTVAVVSIAGKIINEEILKAGMGWFFTKYCRATFCNQWKQYEEQARGKRIGLWVMQSPTPPWDFRHATTNQGSSNKK